MALASKQNEKLFPACVVGGGLTGLVAALELAPKCAARGQNLALIAPVQKINDKRTTALMMPSIEFLDGLGVWDGLVSVSAPLQTMRLIDGSQRLIRSPVTDFRASEVGLDAFGYNVPNAELIERLELALSQIPNVIRVDGLAGSVDCLDDHVCVELTSGEMVHAELAVAADGRNSMVRQSAGIKTRTWSYPQTALVLTFAHSLPHAGVSAEFHTETGPFTQVPLPPSAENAHRSSLVWVVRPEQADSISAKSLVELSLMIETKLQSCFGKVEVECAPQSFKLIGMTAQRFADSRVILVGEAAHVFPPIGAQGFNLGIRDVIELGKRVAESQDFGSKVVTDSYHQNRAADIHLRTSGVDVLNRSLLSNFLPIQIARTLGISALGNISWLKRFAMQRGLGHSST